MARGELEELFERFRDRGDLAALAQVFDRTAPQLLSVARHLASAEAAAEDLVQATFVAAIEHAQRFETSRELVPWLTGILTNKAKLARALGARETDVERLERREELDPALDAELREFVTTLERALERVPSQYRDVLRKHLGDGKKPEQIARELGSAPGTVRVQLHRALAHLRRVLPPGFALGAAMWLGSPRGLAAVRADVLRHAQTGIGTAAGASALTIGGMLMTLKSLMIAAAALIAALGLWWLTRGEAVMPQVALADANAVVVAPDEPAPTNETPVEPAVDAREPVAVPTVPEPAVPSTRGALDIEVVWHDGTPAPGIKLEITPLGERQPNQHRRFVSTDEQGRASVDELMQGDVRVRVGHLMRMEQPTLTHVMAVQRQSLRIPIQRGVDVSGRVVDFDGEAVSGARIWFSDGLYSGDADEVARSGADGRFEVRSLECCQGNLFAISEEHGTSPAIEFPTAKELTEAAAGSVDTTKCEGIELVVDGSHAAIEGVVLDDESGRPIAGARVAWVASNTKHGDHVWRQTPIWQHTDASGSFRFAGLRPMYGQVAVSAEGFADCAERRHLSEDDVDHFEMRLARGVSLLGSVRGPDGAPIAGAKVTQLTGQQFARDFHSVWTISDLNGEFRLDNLAAGEFGLELVAMIDGLERRLEAKFNAVYGRELTWNAQLEGGQAIAGHVLDPQSAPLAGWTVVAHGQSERIIEGGPRTLTDANGRFEIKSLADSRYALLLFAPDRSLMAELDGVMPGRADVMLVGDSDDFPTAFLQGRVVDAHGTPIRARVSAFSVRTRRGDLAEPSVDGRFRLGPLQRGNLTLWIECDGHEELNRIERTIEALAAREDRDLGDIVVP